MNEDRTNSNKLLDTTDCLEAVGVFRGWKNFLFVIVILCLLLLQLSFWLVDAGLVKTDSNAQSDSPVVTAKDVEKTDKAIKPVAKKADEISEAAKQVIADSNQPAETPQQPKQAFFFFSNVKFKDLVWLIRFVNFGLIPVAMLYCLTMLFSLKVSLLGRLGGINHISRAFFLSLAFLILLLPWQQVFAPVITGAMYSPRELLTSCAAVDDKGIFGTALYYLRFTGLWVLVLLLLIFSQIRSARWAKAILGRLEVI